MLNPAILIHYQSLISWYNMDGSPPIRVRVQPYRYARIRVQGAPFDLDSKHRILRGFLQETGDCLEQS